MSKTIILGDVHLGKGISIGKPSVDGSLNSRTSDQVNLLHWVANTAISHNVDRIIITGDIFEDVKPDNNLFLIFMNWLHYCASNNILVDIIAGNHDLKRIGSRYMSVLDIVEASDIPGVNVYNKVYTIHTEGVSFTLIPFRDRRSLECANIPDAIEKLGHCLPFELADIPYGNDKVVVGHLAIEKSFYTSEIDDISNELMVPVDMFKGYDYVWMGHVHKPQVMSKNNPYVAHVGSMDLSDFGETGQTKIIILYDPNTEDKFVQIPIPSRPLRKIILEIPKDEDPTEYLLDEINKIQKKSSFNNAIVKLEVKIADPDSIELDRSKAVQLLSSFGAFHISNFSESRAVALIADNKKHIQDSAIDPKTAVKLYADILEHQDDDEKNEFIALCNEIITETTSNKKE